MYIMSILTYITHSYPKNLSIKKEVFVIKSNNQKDYLHE